MCGIFGFVGKRARAESLDLQVALKSLHHRGPDDRGTYFAVSKMSPDIACAFAHTRLAIIDLSAAGHQPMSTGDGRLTVVYNGEIYNFREIRAELQRAGYPFRSNCDTEVVLQAYAEWGEDCVSRFRGMFAFAIWDSGASRLFLARDRLGVKPLYYAMADGGDLAFGSEVRPFLATGLVQRRLSRSALGDYLSFGAVSEPETIVEGLRAFPPAHCATFTPSSFTLSRYWSMPAGNGMECDFETAVAEIKPFLRHSVQSELLSDVPLGVFLSGGIDSSVITALASAESNQPVHTFTVTFDEEAYNEEKYAAAVASRYGTDHHQVHLRGGDAAADIDRVIDALDQPSADGMNTFFVAEAARKAGLAVVLSGVGGDELFAGYPSFRYFGTLLRIGKAARMFGSSLLPSFKTGINGRSSRTSKTLALLAAGGNPQRTYAVVRNMFTDRQVEELLLPLGSGSKAVRDEEANGQAGDPVNLLSRFELSHYVPYTLLRDTDAMSMAHSLEVRVPLLDHELVEKALSIPGRLKIREPNKALMSSAIADLPDEVRHRPKSGFVLPLEAWFRGSLRPRISEWLTGTTAAPFLNRSAVDRLWQAFLRGTMSYSRVWCVAALIAWCERNRMN